MDINLSNSPWYYSMLGMLDRKLHTYLTVLFFFSMKADNSCTQGSVLNRHPSGIWEFIIKRIYLNYFFFPYQGHPIFDYTNAPYTKTLIIFFPISRPTKYLLHASFYKVPKSLVFSVPSLELIYFYEIAVGFKKSGLMKSFFTLPSPFIDWFVN